MSDNATVPTAEHPTLSRIKKQFTGKGLKAAEFHGQTTVVVPGNHLHEVLQFLRDDPECAYDFLSDVCGVDYLNYPGQTKLSGRFGVVYNLVSTKFNRRFFVRVHLEPTLDTSGTLDDPGLHIPSACDIWAGAEWNEREVYDMFGIHFDNHPDLRRILLWADFPAFPLRKDYPIEGRGERESFRVLNRDSA